MLEQIKQEATTFGKALGNAGKWHMVGIISRVLGLFLLIFTVVLCALALFTFGAVAAIDAMSAYMPVWAAALIMGSAYLLLIIVVIICRKPLFVHPFIRLLSKQVIGTQEELDLMTLKAEHEVDLQKVKIETKVENATREFNFYANLITRAWNTISGWIRK